VKVKFERFKHSDIGWKVITISPRFTIVNNLPVALGFGQPEQQESRSPHHDPIFLEPGESSPFHWPSGKYDKKLCFSVDRSVEWSWTTGIDVTEVGETEVKVRKQEGKGGGADSGRDFMILRVDVDLTDTSINVVVKAPGGVVGQSARTQAPLSSSAAVEAYAAMQSRTSTASTSTTFTQAMDNLLGFCPTYVIENKLDFDVRVRQAHTDEAEWDVFSAQTLSPFALDSLGVSKREVTVEGLIPGRNPLQFGVFSLDKLNEAKPISLDDGSGGGSGKQVHCAMLARGPMKALVLSYDANDAKVVTKKDVKKTVKTRNKQLKKGKKTKSSAKAMRDRMMTSQTGVAEMALSLSVKNVAVSLFDEKPAEFLYIGISDVQMAMMKSPTSMRLEVDVGYLQIDNKIIDVSAPVLLFPLIPGSNKAFLTLVMVQDLSQPSITHFDYLSVLIQALNVRVEQQLLDKILVMVKVLNPIGSKFKEAMDESGLLPTEEEKEKKAKMEERKKVYFEIFQIHPLKITLSFSLSSSTSEVGNIASPLYSILKSLGVVITSINEATIKLGSLVLIQPFVTQKQLSKRITKHYTVQGIRAGLRLLGSFEFLGDPVGLVGGLGSAVLNFFYEPAQGAVLGPEEFAEGLKTASIGLLRGSIFAAFGSVGKITGTIGRGLATLSLDKDYVQKRARDRAEKAPKNPFSGFARGAKRLGKGIFDGITGIFVQPIKGAKKGGAKGFFKGIGKGFLGVAVKPATGVLDFASMTTEGISSTAKLLSGEVDVRPQRFQKLAGKGGVLVPYDHAKCAAMFFTRRLEGDNAETVYVNAFIFVNEAGKDRVKAKEEGKDACVLAITMRGVIIGNVTSRKKVKSIGFTKKTKVMVKEEKHALTVCLVEPPAKKSIIKKKDHVEVVFVTDDPQEANYVARAIASTIE